MVPVVLCSGTAHSALAASSAATGRTLAASAAAASAARIPSACVRRPARAAFAAATVAANTGRAAARAPFAVAAIRHKNDIIEPAQRGAIDRGQGQHRAGHDGE